MAHRIDQSVNFRAAHPPVLTPGEVRTLRLSRELLFLAGLRPIVAAKLRYYADPEFAGMSDPANPVADP